MRVSTVTSNSYQGLSKLLFIQTNDAESSRRACRTRVSREFKFTSRSAMFLAGIMAVPVLSCTPCARGGDAVTWGGDYRWTPPVYVPVATRIWARGQTCYVETRPGSFVARFSYAGIPLPPNDLGTVSDLSIGSDHALATLPGGTVRAWGVNTSGQCDVPFGLTGVVQVSAASAYSLALRSSGTVVAWGNNSFGCCTIPATVVGATAISAGYTHACAIVGGGVVKAWGSNSVGQTAVPAGLSSVVSIACGFEFTTAAKANGTVVGWGNPTSPTPPIGLAQVVQVVSSLYHVVARRSDGSVVAWGNNSEGQCNVPSGLSPIVQIAAGDGFSIGLGNDGKVTKWGSSETPFFCSAPIVELAVSRYGHCIARLGNGNVLCWGDSDGYQSGATTVPSDLAPVSRVCAGGDYGASGYLPFSVALTTSGTVRTWGGSLPAPPSGLTGVTSIAAGGSHCLALRSTGSVTAWGVNLFGECNVPTGLGPFSGITAGGRHSAAVRSNTAVACWGDNSSGQCTPPTGLTGVESIVAGSLFTCALKSSGDLIAWGDNSRGQCNVPPNLGEIGRAHV